MAMTCGHHTALAKGWRSSKHLGGRGLRLSLHRSGRVAWSPRRTQSSQAQGATGALSPLSSLCHSCPWV